ncbi:hypothetical protein Y592_04685 [Thermosipho sp. 1070]|nr:hypothetical protein Y592_04685 [Thermosipho sp. 1070]
MIKRNEGSDKEEKMIKKDPSQIEFIFVLR